MKSNKIILFLVEEWFDGTLDTVLSVTPGDFTLGQLATAYQALQTLSQAGFYTMDKKQGSKFQNLVKTSEGFVFESIVDAEEASKIEWQAIGFIRKEKISFFTRRVKGGWSGARSRGSLQNRSTSSAPSQSRRISMRDHPLEDGNLLPVYAGDFFFVWRTVA